MEDHLEELFELEFKLDGKNYPFENVGFFCRKNPFPADHKYKLIIKNINVCKSFTDIYNKGAYTNIEAIYANSFEYYFMKHRPARKKVNYLISTVDKMTVTEEELILEGIASSVIKERQKLDE